MNSIDFGGHRSEVKAMIAIIYKCGVRGDATLCVVIFNYSCIIACFSDVGLPSLFVTALSNISCFCQVECTFLNISTC